MLGKCSCTSFAILQFVPSFMWTTCKQKLKWLEKKDCTSLAIYMMYMC
uniref:Uncharacterized protein n=1 Tax=Aegilops tauschii subsp. strangulata TaxID=200361 RepID=A0A453LWH7_AEGTS